MTKLIIDIFPEEDQIDDFDTLTITEDIRFVVQNELSKFEDFKLNKNVSSSRSGSLIEFVSTLTQNVLNNKELIVSLLELVIKAIDILSKQNQIKKLELIVNGDKFVVEGASQKMAQLLLEQLNKEYTSETIKADYPITIKASVSSNKEIN